MKYKEEILEGFFVKRYKRFFVDLKIDNEVVTAYCPNTGSLLGLLKEDSKVLVAKVENPNAKLKYRLEAIKDYKTFVGVNTSLPNDIVFNAMKKKKILQEIKGDLKKEVKYGKNSRVDIFASHPNGDTYIEVKSVTLLRKNNLAEFPDAVTSRGLKHLNELLKAYKKGFKIYLLFLIQRDDCKTLRIAGDIDPEYKKLLIKAIKNKLHVLCYDCKFTSKGIKLNQQIEFRIE